MVQPGVASVMVVGGVHPDLSAEETPSGINTTFLTDETTPQWKRVLQDCNVKVTYALSLLKPRAKWNDPMVGSRTDSSVLVSEKRLKKSNRPRGFLIMNSTDITTSRSTPLPRKSPICDSKEP